jgi:hypothetical protein
MRTSAIVLVLLLCVEFAAAQGGHIGLYSDSPGYTDCNLTETLFAANNVYVVHTLAATGNTSQFKVEDHWGVLRGPVDYGFNLYLGDIYTGITVTYVGCKLLPYRIATLTFIPTTATAPCYEALRVVADPAVASGQVEVVDCNSNVLLATGGYLCVNAPDCCVADPFQATLSPGDCFPVGVEPSTWGGVKALYQ